MEDCPKGLEIKCPYAGVLQAIGEREYPKQGICFGNLDECTSWQKSLKLEEVKSGKAKPRRMIRYDVSR